MRSVFNHLLLFLCLADLLFLLTNLLATPLAFSSPSSLLSVVLLLHPVPRLDLGPQRHPGDRPPHLAGPVAAALHQSDGGGPEEERQETADLRDELDERLRPVGDRHEVGGGHGQLQHDGLDILTRGNLDTAGLVKENPLSPLPCPAGGA